MDWRCFAYCSTSVVRNMACRFKMKPAKTKTLSSVNTAHWGCDLKTNCFKLCFLQMYHPNYHQRNCPCPPEMVCALQWFCEQHYLTHRGWPYISLLRPNRIKRESWTPLSFGNPHNIWFLLRELPEDGSLKVISTLLGSLRWDDSLT